MALYGSIGSSSWLSIEWQALLNHILAKLEASLIKSRWLQWLLTRCSNWYTSTTVSLPMYQSARTPSNYSCTSSLQAAQKCKKSGSKNTSENWEWQFMTTYDNWCCITSFHISGSYFASHLQLELWWCLMALDLARTNSWRQGTCPNGADHGTAWSCTTSTEKHQQLIIMFPLDGYRMDYVLCLDRPTWHCCLYTGYTITSS